MGGFVYEGANTGCKKLCSDKKIQNSQFANQSSKRNIIFDKITTYDQFLQKSALASSSSLVSLSVSLSATPFSLKVQVEALKYLGPITLWYTYAQK